MNFPLPSTLKQEHEELHAQLHEFMNEPANVGAAARAVAHVLHPHMVREEIFAIPPLSLLPALAKGELTPEMADVLELTDRMRHELPMLLEEHKVIFTAVNALLHAARAAKRVEVVKFAEKLALHARIEEDLLYPTAILVGDYVRLAMMEESVE